MSHAAERGAQERADRVAAFRAELAELEREGALVLSPEQRAGLDAHLEVVLEDLRKRFGVDVDASAKRFSLGMRIGALLGGAAFSAAVVLFLHRVWGVLSSPAQVAILTALPICLLLAADLVHRRGAALYYTGLLALAAAAAFVTGSSVLGSTLNLAPSPHAILAWGLFAILAAHAFGLRLLLGAGLVLLCAYAAALCVSLEGSWWTSYLNRAGFLIPGAFVCYALPSLWPERPEKPQRESFAFVHRACGAATAMVALLVLSLRDDLSFGGLPSRTLAALYQIAGLALSAGVVLHGLRLGRGGLVNLGAAGFVVFLYVRLHVWWWEWMPKYLFFLVIGLIAVALLLAFRRLRARLSSRRVPS